jgi:hypothetical protein
MASAMVTGAVALIRSQRPGWGREQILTALLAGVDNIDSENPDYTCLLGVGRLNLNLALVYAVSCSLTSPNGGEIWIPGDSATVAWTGEGFEGGIVLSLNRDFPYGQWEDIFAGMPTTDSVHVAVTDPACAHARLRITSQLSSMIGDTSDSDFVIGLAENYHLPLFTMNDPKPNDELYVDAWFPFLWTTSTTIGTVTLSLNRDYPHGEWEDILLHTANDGCAFWKVSGPTCSGARLRIISDDFPAEGDTAEGYFSISFRPTSFAPSIRVLSPNGGEAWYEGEVKKIKWSCDGDCDSVIIMVCDEYRFPNGPCETILVTANDFSETWVVSHEPTPRARILVVCSDVKESADRSDSPLAIVGSPQVTVDVQDTNIVLRWFPTGAESYTVYSSREPMGVFSELEAVTIDTFFVDEEILEYGASRFYQVRSFSSGHNDTDGNGIGYRDSSMH